MEGLRENVNERSDKEKMAEMEYKKGRKRRIWEMVHNCWIS